MQIKYTYLSEEDPKHPPGGAEPDPEDDPGEWESVLDVPMPWYPFEKEREVVTDLGGDKIEDDDDESK